ncbi:MAG: DNA-3-methyladenine glycosylase [Holophagaceae bacterium]|uniref:DNA-3-methyladenine glycosylase n=1 Tax=Candidatus Geothrix odensensis TaxID=2954440 RepID=A0A936K7B1_9BACT|nr:DNA-3-methyladenine glycosylase [Candidatus Geothrix odensensis]
MFRDEHAGPSPPRPPGSWSQVLVRAEVTLRITEVEAYGGPGDSASHARHGRTARNAPRMGPRAGPTLYLCYGMHWMLNGETGPEGEASAVLIRGAEVVAGLDHRVWPPGRLPGPRPCSAQPQEGWPRPCGSTLPSTATTC